jgi:hypothetical protein
MFNYEGMFMCRGTYFYMYLKKKSKNDKNSRVHFFKNQTVDAKLKF